MNALRTLSVVLLLCPVLASAGTKQDALPPIMDAMWVNKGMMEFCLTKGAISETESKVALKGLDTVVKHLDGFFPGLSSQYTEVYEKAKQGIFSQEGKELNFNELGQASEQDHAKTIATLCKNAQKELSSTQSLQGVLKHIDALMK